MAEDAKTTVDGSTVLPDDDEKVNPEDAPSGEPFDGDTHDDEATEQGDTTLHEDEEVFPDEDA